MLYFSCSLRAGQLDSERRIAIIVIHKIALFISHHTSDGGGRNGPRPDEEVQRVDGPCPNSPGDMERGGSTPGAAPKGHFNLRARFCCRFAADAVAVDRGHNYLWLAIAADVVSIDGRETFGNASGAGSRPFIERLVSVNRSARRPGGGSNQHSQTLLPTGHDTRCGRPSPGPITGVGRVPPGPLWCRAERSPRRRRPCP
jgi:hypothetical protein